MIKFNISQDKILVIAPSGATATYHISCANLDMAIKLLESYNFIAQAPHNIFSKNPVTSYYRYSNSKEVRLQQLTEALLDPSVKVIWCFRGGAGANEVVHDLIRSNIAPRGEKVFIGFSDATLLLLYSTQVLNFSSIHGPVLNELGETPLLIEDVISFIQGNPVSIDLTPINNKAKNIDKNGIAAKVSGGNLSIIQSAIGTNLHPDFNNKILILEDTAEFPFQIKRTLVHMLESQIINTNLSGIIFGKFNTKYPEYDLKNIEAIKDFVNSYIKNEVPCFLTKDFGHGNINKPIPFNAKVTLSASSMKYEGIFDIIKSK